MTSKLAVALVVIIICFLMFPILIGFAGGLFGLVAGVIGGVFGLVFGAIGAIIGAIVGAIGEIFNLIFSWPSCSFFDGNFFVVVALIIVAVLVSRKRNVERRHRPMK